MLLVVILLRLNHVYNVIRETLVENGIDVANIDPLYKDERQGDIRDSLANLDKISSLLDYKPFFSFEEGMKLYIEGLLDKS